MTRTVIPAPQHPAVGARGQQAGPAGDFTGVGSLVVLHGELLCETVDVHPGERVLDVIAGNGAASLAAARRGADVTATDRADQDFESLQRIAEIQGLVLHTRVVDAQDLPFDDDTFDVVLSAFGAMFAPDHQRVADELVRVCRPGGRIGMANWAPVSLIGDVFRASSTHVIPPAGLRSAIEWGSGDHVCELFGNRVRQLHIETRVFTFRHRSTGHLLEWFRTGHRPTKAAFERLDAEGQARLAADLIAIVHAYNRADDGTVVAPSDYLEVVAVVR